MIERMSSRWSMMLDQMHMQRLSQEINEGRSRMNSGQKILQPSDDPLSSARIAEIDDAKARKENDLRTIARMQDRWQSIDLQLGNMHKDVQRALEIAIAANTATASLSDKATWAQELASLRNTLFASANMRDTQNAPLFTSGQMDTYTLDDEGLYHFQEQGALARIDVGDGHSIEIGLRLHSYVGSPANVEDGEDLLTELQSLETNLKSATPNADAMAASITRLRRFADRLSDAMAATGTETARLEALVKNGEAYILHLKESRSALADTEVAVEIANIDQNNLILDATRALFAKLRSKTLLDYLR